MIQNNIVSKESFCMYKVLIASKNIEGVKKYSQVLKRNDFYVDEYYDSFEVLKIADLSIYDVIILGGDVSDSIRITENIRLNTYANIIILDNVFQPEYGIKAFEAGAEDYYVKTGNPMLLTAKIKALIRRNKVLVDRIINVGDFKFDLEKEICYFNNEELNITHREFRILFYLLKNQKRIISKEELYYAVWNKQLGEDKSPFWTAMSRLNKKIEKYCNDFSIDSNREGYQLYIRK